ncbi:hypothetical protein G5I_12026 [Acromyrmex echinatior]|uniref:Uncharacterized protein n=1 Tax=Acromyrmex echinatior TaxID=103372 RepID=F4X168_ACREC|nr:hypothetical protein G5I_12026 [Acromyrmex echinatior]
MEAARISLLRIRGLRQETIEFQKEFAEMRNCNKMANNHEMPRNCQPDIVLNIEAEKGSSLNWNMRNKFKHIQRTILLPEVWKPFVILNLYFLWQQFSGLYVIIIYAVDMIKRIDITIDPFFITVIVGVVQLIGNMVTTFCSMRIAVREERLHSVWLHNGIIYVRRYSSTLPVRLRHGGNLESIIAGASLPNQAPPLSATAASSLTGPPALQPRLLEAWRSCEGPLQVVEKLRPGCHHHHYYCQLLKITRRPLRNVVLFPKHLID